MIKGLIMRLIQSREFIQSKGWPAFMRELVFINRKAILFEKNLLEVIEQKNSSKKKLLILLS